MRKIFLLFLLILTNMPCLQAGEFIKIKELLAKSSFWDSKEVEVKAEVLDVLRRKKGSWINILDQGVSLGVWVPKEVELPQIIYLAGPEERGDLIRIRGRFYFNNPRHLGQTMISAEKISLVKRGGKFSLEPSLKKRRALFLWALLFLITGTVYLIRNLRYARGTSKT
ncbi:MAG TPA: hypothetical protein ENI31_07515 [Candidatus Omnitrophica bacterium]|nr:MAG: hypothetical protein DRP61_00535 [Candidatus Omnitrophota bacterium]RKY35804.1 MAG: hypothetical protein DRP69_00145 [Candidatus Omnitrophota bacterium]RKY44656.1 MAG: hypothetical protein DRP80_01710 [Candidatus Omnitrophota bacterium]HEC70113.1 hypothetical protein [Candidatus Omnitrophota bacterium]